MVYTKNNAVRDMINTIIKDIHGLQGRLLVETFMDCQDKTKNPERRKKIKQFKNRLREVMDSLKIIEEAGKYKEVTEAQEEEEEKAKQMISKLKDIHKDDKV